MGTDILTRPRKSTVVFERQGRNMARFQIEANDFGRPQYV
jgi:hypothetical protein